MNKIAQLTWKIAVLTTGLFSSALSQTTSSVPDNKDEPLKLEDFIVGGEKTTGYRATNSISATGIGSRIGDTPSTIQVVTKDLITDTRSDLINDTLHFVPGVVTGPTNESQPFIRGFQGTYTLRNGVFRRQNLTTWNVDRVEVIQGPSSIFYSNIRPGGVINYITIKPVLGQNFIETSLAAGTDSYWRAEGDFNVAAGKNLAFRAVVGQLSTDSFRIENNETQSFVSLSMLWKISDNHQITLEFGDEETHRLNSWTAYIAPLTNSRYFNNPAAIASGQTLSAFMAANYPGLPIYDQFAAFAPSPSDPYGRVTPVLTNTYQHGSDKPIDLTYTGKITDQLVFNTVLNYAWEDNEGVNPSWAGDLMANDTFINFSADRFVNVRDSYNVNSRLTYRFNLGQAENTVMAGNDNQWIWQRYPQVNGSANQTGPKFTYAPQTMPAANGSVLWQSSPAPFNSLRDTLQYFQGTYIVDQVSLLKDSLFLIVGERYTNFRQHVKYPRNPALQANAQPDAVAKKWTPQAGALYKLTKGLSVFGTYSESVIPQTQIDASGRTVQPITAKGYDLGLKTDLLDGALTGTLDYYYIYQSNVAISNAAQNIAHGLPANATFGYYDYGNAQRVRGLQIDLNYNISQNYQLVLAANHFMEANFVAPQSNALNIGVPIAYQPKNIVTVWNRYQASSGAIKGLILGGGLRYQSEAAYGGDFNRSRLLIPSFTVVDALIGYDAKFFEHRLQFRINVKNVFDKIYREGAGGSFASGRTIIGSVSARF